MSFFYFCIAFLLGTSSLASAIENLQNKSVRIFPDVTVFNGKTMDIIGDSLEEIAKLRAFPVEKYTIYDVPTLGAFYVDLPQDTIKGTLKAGNVWEPNIVELIKEYAKEGSVAVDLGSHIGTHLLSMSQAVGKNGLVVGFEPQMKIFSELIMNMQLNQCSNVRAYRCAVGRNFDQVQMNIPYSSNEGGASIGRGGDIAKLIPLDSLQLCNVSIIKIDVEGYEDEVLAGAVQTIRDNHPYIIIELMDSNEEQVNKRDATIKNLEEMGYTLQKLWGWDWFAIPRLCN